MAGIKTLKISISGVRGIIGESLPIVIVERFAQSFSTYTNSGLIVIGRDTRTSGEMIKHAVIAGLLSTGCQIIDLDIVPVPTIQYIVEKFHASGGIAITASHNPPEWNALKFIRRDGSFLNSYEAEELLDIYHQGEFNLCNIDNLKKISVLENSINIHLEGIMKCIDSELIKKKKIKVAIDSCNGAGATMSKILLSSLNCKIYPINMIQNGIFPHPPEPRPENLKELCKVVKKEKCDIGFAQDADADRLAIVLPSGIPAGEDYTLSIVSDYVLSKEPAPLVTNISTSSLIDFIAKKHNCKIIKTKVGEVNVTEKMREVNSTIGGEGNGGVIYPKLHYARDSFIGMALILQYLAESNETIENLIKDYPKFVIIKKKISLPSDKIFKIIREIKEFYCNENIDLTDGIKIFRNGGWVHIRPSNTEPILRIISESTSKIHCEELIEEVFSHINENFTILD